MNKILIGVTAAAIGAAVIALWPKEPSQDYPLVVARSLMGEPLFLAENTSHPLLCVATETGDSVSYRRCDGDGSCSSWDRGSGPAIIGGQTYYVRVMPGASYRHFCVSDLKALQIHAQRDGDESTMILLKHDGSGINERWDASG